MARPPFTMTAPPGSQIWNWIGDTRQLAPGLNARPAWLRFRTTLLSSAAPAQTDPLAPRVNADFDFIWTSSVGWIEAQAADGIVSHLAYVQLTGAQGFPIFDRAMPFSAWGQAYGAAANLTYVPNGLSWTQNAIPYCFAAGESITATFTADAAFPGTGRIAELILAGAYVSKDATILQPSERVELVVRMGKSLRRFLELTTGKLAARAAGR